MTRKEFLNVIGVGGSSILLSMCMGGCGKEPTTTPVLNNDLILDLTDPEYASLLIPGNYIQHKNGITIAYTNDKNYIAANLTCPHEQGTIKYDKSTNNLRCEKHNDQTYTNSAGVSNNAKTSSNLPMYDVVKNGNTLTIKA